MQRTAINPWDWSLEFGFNQAELITGPTRQLICSGQTAVDASGAPQHPGDMPAQMALALDNLEAVLKAADMELEHIVRLHVYTTDVDATRDNMRLLGQRFGPAGVKPPMALLGVTSLALPPLMVELEATAMA